jgi:hypothetical protein
MKQSLSLRSAGWIAALIGWSALAFWVFSLSYSTSYFHYSLASRLPPFVAAFGGAIAIPVSAYLLLQRVARRQLSPVRAWLSHAGLCVVAVVPLAVTAAVLSRIRGPMHLSGDDAMGVGINFAILVLIAMVSCLFMAVVLAVKRKAASHPASIRD